jgi:hypothetical protein
MNDFPKERQVLTKYRKVLHSVLFNGLRKWRQAGLLGQITNGQQFGRALEMLYNTPERSFPREVDPEQRSKFIEDSKWIIHPTHPTSNSSCIS